MKPTRLKKGRQILSKLHITSVKAFIAGFRGEYISQAVHSCLNITDNSSQLTLNLAPP
jgi:hypothetical protein